MKKIVVLFLVLALCLSLAGALADGTITVNGTGEALVNADTAVVSIGVNARKSTAPEAQGAANEVIASIRAALTAAGVSEEDISTGYVSLYAVYDYTKDIETVVGYNASSTLAIRVTDIDRVGEVIDLAFGAGANSLDGVSFSVSDTAAARAEALKAAYADAKEKADILAEASGQQIAIQSIQEGSVYSYDGGSGNFSRKAAGNGIEAETDSPTVVRAAKIRVTASITVTYSIVH